MRQTTLKPTKRGYVRNIGPKGNEHKFRLGFDRNEALRRLNAIQALWLQCEEPLKHYGKAVRPSWDEARLAAAKAIAKGEAVIPLPANRGEEHEKYLDRVGATRRVLPGIMFQPDEDHLAIGVYFKSSTAEQERSAVAQAIGIPRATGQKFFEALEAYKDHIRDEYKDEDGRPNDNGQHMLGNVKSLMRYLPDCDLGALDYSGCDERYAILRRRPTRTETKKPMKRSTVKNLMGELGRFFRWLHLSPNFNFRLPDDFALIKKKIAEFDSDIAAEANDIPTWTLDELKVLNEYATPLERLMFYLGLNAAYCADQIGRLEDGAIRQLKSGGHYLNRLRRKKKTLALHLLFPQTHEGLMWAQKRKRQFGVTSPFTLVTKNGLPYWKKTKGNNRSQVIPNIWKGLIARIRKDPQHKTFRFLPFNSLRDTSGDLVRQLARSGEIASLHIAHKHSTDDPNLKSYSNPLRKQHWRSLRKLHVHLQPVFDAAGPTPWSHRKSNVGQAKIKRIRALATGGMRPVEIARTVGVSIPTVYRWMPRKAK